MSRQHYYYLVDEKTFDRLKNREQCFLRSVQWDYPQKDDEIGIFKDPTMAGAPDLSFSAGHVEYLKTDDDGVHCIISLKNVHRYPNGT